MLRSKMYLIAAAVSISLMGAAFTSGYFYKAHRVNAANMKAEIEGFKRADEIEKRLIATEAQLVEERRKLEELARAEPATIAQCLSPSRVRRLNQIR